METFKQQLPLFTTIGGLISGFILSLGLGLVNYIKLLYYAFESPSYPIEITYVSLILKNEIFKNTLRKPIILYLPLYKVRILRNNILRNIISLYLYMKI
nr:hypothetical protein [Bacillus cereus]